MSRIRILVFATLASAGAMFAQSTRSVIVGTVTDQSGAAVPAAEVNISNEKTNIATKTSTSSDGQFSVTNLEPGPYRVSVSATGFKTGNIRDVVIQVNQTARVDVRLDVGDVAATVEVQSAAP